jgi:hypothetical protein
MKIHPVGAELFHVVRRTDMSKLIVAFRNFANAPKRKFETLEHCCFLKQMMKDRQRQLCMDSTLFSCSLTFESLLVT